MFKPEAAQSVTREDIIEAVESALTFLEIGDYPSVEIELLDLLEKFED